eukprot:CAMPEP_0176003904 /NCGR_PEP_ID=MMETSP0120_2-20121206/1414_1 /TAXON_ID=160619 /ORGANISM="Kryptoperidinium foliaceum, Strain CCMP 1326" /LENGTH=405 /DNA_ID=CAMNT_0017336561 /DNA_START=22 /DNA_END=1236 /DNA_ORIENTATION=+
MGVSSVPLRDGEANPEAVMQVVAFDIVNGATPSSEQKQRQPDPAAVPPTPPQNKFLLQAGVLGFFTLSRALHPLIISKTKVDGRYPHEPLSVPLAECVLTFIVAQVMVLAKDGVSGWREIWRPKPMLVFSMISVILSIGDFLELASLGNVSGTVYQLFCQSKLIITATLLYAIKGTRQSGLQWLLLLMLTLALCLDAVMRDILTKHRAFKSGEVQEEAATQAAASTFRVGIALVLLKVVISCLAAVLSDKTFKDYPNVPLYVQLVRFKPVWFLGLLLIAVIRGDVQEHGVTGFFHDWQAITVCALVSFTVKCWISFSVLSILDSLAKNIGEAFSVLVTYFIVIFHASFDDVYENETFLTILLVFLSILAYLSAKKVVGKAETYDKIVQNELARALQGTESARAVP